MISRAYRFAKYRVVGGIARTLDLHRARARLLGSSSLSDRERAMLGAVALRTHVDDRMYVSGEGVHYLEVGLSALRAIDGALAVAAPPVEPATILDFGCGYGRVLRFLRVGFPAARVTASDRDAKALAFCRDTFAVRAEPSHDRFRTLLRAERFDLVWCGSVITHIDDALTADLLAFFHDRLAPGGICIFSTHGTRSAEWVRSGTNTYGLGDSARRQLLSQFEATGYGYVDYRGHRGYGISIVSRGRMAALARAAGTWREVSFLEHGWLDHQDVYAYAAVASPILVSS